MLARAMTVKVDISNDCPGFEVPSKSVVQSWLSTACLIIAHEEQQLNVSIRVINELESAQLNKKYRGKDKATNVLSFPCEMSTELKSLHSHAPLGDIAICAPVVAAEAESQGKSLNAHWAHLLTHGLLHLRGFDHDTDVNATQMEALEIEVLNKLGFANPYEI